MENTKIGILGVGAIGSVISTLLRKNVSNNLYYYNRTPKKNIKVVSETEVLEFPIDMQTAEGMVPDLDWLIVCIKEHHYQETDFWFQKLIKPTTNVGIVRNGLRLKEPLLQYTREEKILECMIDCPTESIENGVYKQLRRPVLTVPSQALTQKFKELFEQSSLEINATPDFKTENWKKLSESASLGAVLCLSGETCRIFKDEKMRLLYRRILEESLSVAKADGAKIESNFLDEATVKLMSYPETKGSSMLTDRLNGNPIELGAKNGIISKLGKEYGINTPLNDLVTDLLTHTNQKDN